MRPRQFVDGWSIGPRERWEERHGGGHRTEPGEGHPRPTGARPPQTGDGGATAPQGHPPRQKGSLEAEDGQRVSDPYERHHSWGHDRTGGLKQTDQQLHSGQGQTSEPRTNFHTHLNEQDRSSSNTHDNRSSSELGTGGYRP
ncbi:hypothetical protein [Streptomyces massasporeus]|uniref:hypothetical protein n=1 Tax=Streptomyces massasporeus TaxID=67324 RepID=UPI0036ABBEF1